MRRIFSFVTAAATAAALGLGASNAAAQACVGTPTLNGQRALSGGIGFPNGGTNYQARLDVNRGGPTAYHVNFSHLEADAAANRNTVGAGLAYQLGSPVVPGEVPISGCPMVGASYAWTTGAGLDQDRLDVPVGFGLGTRINVGAGTSLVPYVMPKFVFSRTSTRVDGQTTTATDHGFGATAGAAVDFGPFFAGVDYSSTRWNDVPATDSNLGLRLGVKF